MPLLFVLVCWERFFYGRLQQNLSIFIGVADCCSEFRQTFAIQFSKPVFKLISRIKQL
jgi:hypothetical protein